MIAIMSFLSASFHLPLSNSIHPTNDANRIGKS